MRVATLRIAGIDKQSAGRMVTSHRERLVDQSSVVTKFGRCRSKCVIGRSVSLIASTAASHCPDAPVHSLDRPRASVHTPTASPPGQSA